jgi:mRNA (2'-O-methyladenosine-N6-)-methyltransferase
MSSKRSNLRDKLKKRREAIGSILSQATPPVSSSPSSATADPVISPSTEVKKEQPKNEPDPASSFERNKKRSISAVDPKSSSQLGNKKVKVDSDDLMSLLSAQSAKEKADQKQRDEILELLGKPTAKEQENFEMFRNNSGKQLKQFCKHSTKYECTRATGSKRPCDNLHFVKIIQPHTDESLGDCSFLNTCFHMDTCKYIHYEVDQDDVRRAEKRKRSVHHPDSSGSANGQQKLNSTKSFGGNNSINGMSKSTDGTSQRSSIGSGIKLVPPQWVQCDLRNLDLPVLGKFSVVMADPPWDIHMELPYGTMSDDEMRKLPVPTLQDEG